MTDDLESSDGQRGRSSNTKLMKVQLRFKIEEARVSAVILKQPYPEPPLPGTPDYNKIAELSSALSPDDSSDSSVSQAGVRRSRSPFLNTRSSIQTAVKPSLRLLCSHLPFRRKPIASGACIKLLLRKIHEATSKSVLMCWIIWQKSASFGDFSLWILFIFSDRARDGRAVCFPSTDLDCNLHAQVGRCLQEAIPFTVEKYYRFISMPRWLCVYCRSVRLCEWVQGSMWQEQEVVTWCNFICKSTSSR